MKNWDDIFIEMALLISQRSTCCKKQVGAVITKDHKVISVGYNGVVSGAQHCTEVLKSMIIEQSKWGGQLTLNNSKVFRIDIKSEKFAIEVPYDFANDIPEYICNQMIEKDYIKGWHSEWSAKNEIHAEINCILNATQSVKDANMYVTLSPCIDCAKIIVASGIKKLYYIGEYREDKKDDGLYYLRSQGVDIYR